MLATTQAFRKDNSERTLRCKDAMPNQQMPPLVERKAPMQKRHAQPSSVRVEDTAIPVVNNNRHAGRLAARTMKVD